MIVGTALLIALSVCAPQVGSVEASATLTPIDGASGGAGVHIGQPLHYTIALVGTGSEGAKLSGDALDLGYAWSVVDGPRDARGAIVAPVDGVAPLAGDPLAVDPQAVGTLAAEARPSVRMQWTVIALGSGSAVAPPVEVKLIDGESVTVPAVTLEVLPELAEGEDAPRPMRGFRDVEDRRLGDPRLVLAAAALLLLLPIVALGALRFRRRPRALDMATPVVAPLEAIDALDAATDPRGTMSALGPLLRRALDEALGRDGASLTDKEWAAGLETADGLPEADRRAAIDLVEELSAVRFGGGDPTSFAAKDAVERARRLVLRSPAELAPAGATPADSGRAESTSDAGEVSP